MCFLFGNKAVDEIMGLYICADVRHPSFYELYVSWLPVIVYDTMLCLLALWHGIRNWLEYRIRRMDGVNIADAVIKGNVRYFLWYVSALLRQRHRTR